MERPSYSTDLTDAQWERIRDHIPPAKPGGRPRKYEMREVINAILYITRAGCAWRLLPHDLPPWWVAYGYFRAFQEDGTWERLNAHLVRDARKKAGHHPEPRVGYMDSQSVKSTKKGGRTGASASMAES